MVAATLGDIGDPSAIPALIEFVQHHNDELRPAAVKALLTISHRSAVPQLVALLNHEEGEIRLYTVAILGRLGYPEAKPYLEKNTRYGSRCGGTKCGCKCAGQSQQPPR